MAPGPEPAAGCERPGAHMTGRRAQASGPAAPAPAPPTSTGSACGGPELRARRRTLATAPAGPPLPPCIAWMLTGAALSVLGRNTPLGGRIGLWARRNGGCGAAVAAGAYCVAGERWEAGREWGVEDKAASAGSSCELAKRPAGASKTWVRPGQNRPEMASFRRHIGLTSTSLVQRAAYRAAGDVCRLVARGAAAGHRPSTPPQAAPGRPLFCARAASAPGRPLFRAHAARAALPLSSAAARRWRRRRPCGD
jgi:hypothetical protein